VIAGQGLVATLALTADSTLFLSFALDERAVSVAGTLHAFPGTPDSTRQALVIDLETIMAYQLAEPGGAFPAPDEYWLALPKQPASAALATLQQPPFGSEQVQSRYERARQLRNDPVTLSTIGALWLSVVVAATFACLGFVTSVAVSLRDRLIEFGLLRVLGLSRRQLAAWLLAENGFLVAICLLCGSAVGLALAWLTLPLITVSRAATEVFPAPLVTVPWLEILAMQALLVTLLLATSLLAMVLLRRIGVGRLLRVDGDV
jgi:putative ABC transport system permease protein